jgi:hypothetical protein
MEFVSYKDARTRCINSLHGNMFERAKAEFIQIIQEHTNNLPGGISQNLSRTFQNIQGDIDTLLRKDQCIQF